VGEFITKEIDDPFEAHPPAARPTLRARTTFHPSDLPRVVCDVGALRRLRGQRRPLGDDRRGDAAHDECGDDDFGGNDHDGAPRDGDDHCSEDDAHDYRALGPNDADDAEEGHADDGLYSPDDRAGHDDDGLFVDAVRSGDLLLGP
jgi:hypothetical protein